MTLEERLRAEREAAAKWIHARQAEVGRGLDRLEAKGRQVYADAIRTGQQVAGRTTSELRELGRKAQAATQSTATGQGRGSDKRASSSRQSGSQPQPRSAPISPKPQAGIGEQLRAGASGFADEFTFGLADRVGAAVGAAADAATGRGEGLLKGYDERLAASQAQDAYDAEHYGLSRGAGQVLGFATSLVGPGGLGVGARLATKAAPRLARLARAANSIDRLAPLTQKGLTLAAAGGGAASGVAGQAVHDALTGEWSSIGDYGGAALGGLVGGVASRAHLPGAKRVGEVVNRAVPRLAGGVDGAVTTLAQGALDGQEVSPLDIAEATRAGVVGARAGELAGKYRAATLGRDAKGKLGETLSKGKSWIEGEGWPTKGAPRTPEIAANLPWTIGAGPQRRVYIPSGKYDAFGNAIPMKRYVVADHVRPSGVAIEAKFGAGAELRRAQPIALEKLGPLGLYRVDHWLPTDIGRMGALATAAVTSPWHFGED